MGVSFKSREERMKDAGNLPEGQYVFQVESVKDGDKSWPLTLFIYNMDGSKFLAADETHKTIKAWFPKAAGRFQDGYIAALLPEVNETGGDIPGIEVVIGRWGLVDVSYGEVQSNGYPRMNLLFSPIPDSMLAMFDQPGAFEPGVEGRPFAGSVQDSRGAKPKPAAKPPAAKPAAPAAPKAAAPAKPAAPAAKPAAPAAPKAAAPAKPAPAKPAPVKPAPAAAAKNPFTG